jgi:RNA polymerase sigma-70 factor (ECF subfamily)
MILDHHLSQSQLAITDNIQGSVTMSQSAFEREALPELDALYNFAYRLCRDEHRSRDLVQETMLKACRYFRSYREGSNCRAWLFQICKNAYINQYRRRKAEPVAVDFSSEEGEFGRDEGSLRERHIVPSDDQHAVLHERSLGDEVVTALEALPNEYRTAVVLCDIEGHTYEDIADFMRVPVGTVRSRIHRGRKMLAGRLSVYATGRRHAVTVEAC